MDDDVAEWVDEKVEAFSEYWKPSFIRPREGGVYAEAGVRCSRRGATWNNTLKRSTAEIMQGERE